MSIRFGLLALLEQKPMYGYQLRQEFERATGATWPLNIGQVYTTLARLERDGLVVLFGPPDDEGRQLYQITENGDAALGMWFETPVQATERPRDELAIKIAMAVTTPGQDITQVLQKQRTSTMRTLQELTRLRAQANVNSDVAWLLVLDSMIFRAEAELRWLNHSESRLTRVANSQRATRNTGVAPAASSASGTTLPSAAGPDARNPRANVAHSETAPPMAELATTSTADTRGEAYGSAR